MLDSGSWTTAEQGVKSFTPQSDLPDGNHVLSVRAQDASGNWSTTSQYTIAVDTVPPNPPQVTAAATNNPARPLWSWTGSNDSASYRYQLDSESAAGWTSSGTGVLSFTPESDLSGAEHTLFVQAADAALNWSASGRASANVLVAAPVVSGQAFASTLTPTWTWTDVGGGAVIEHQLDSTAGAWIMESPGVTSWTYPGVPQLAQGSHTLNVRARNGDLISEISVFTTVIDTVAPGAPSVTGTTPTGERKPTWTWSVPADETSGLAAFRCQLDGEAGTWTDLPLSTTSYQLPFILTEPHTLFVQAGDRAGNWSASGFLRVEPAWRIQTLDTNTAVAGQDIGIVMKSDFPMICYANASTHDLLLQEWNGDIWVRQILDAGGAGARLSLTIDRTGNKGIVYTDPTEHSLKIIYYDVDQHQEKRMVTEANQISAVTKVVAITSTNGWLRFVSARESGIPASYHLYRNNLSRYDLPSEAGSEYGLTAAIDNSNLLSVFSLTASELHFRLGLLNMWTVPTAITSSSGDASCNISVKRDIYTDSSTYHVAYTTPANAILRVSGFGTTPWTSLPTIVHAASATTIGSVQIGADYTRQKVAIVYTVGSDLYCYVNGVEELVDTGVARCAAVAVDSTGKVHVAYYDAATGQLKYSIRN